MSIAVIIPMYNGEKYIAETLESVLAQKQKPDEIVVVDDGSSDSSRDIVRNFPDVLLLKNSGKGSNAARNFGVEHTSSEYLAFIDQDDLWHPEHLALLSNALEHSQDALAAFSKISHFTDGSSPEYALNDGKVNRYNPWDDFPNNYIGEPLCSLLRRDPIKDVGLWSSQFEGVAEYYLWLRLAALGPLVVSESKTAGHRVHESSYGHKLRNNDKLIHYLDIRYQACEEAITHLPDHTNRRLFQEKNRVQAIQKKFIESYIQDDPATVAGLMKDFAMVVKNDSAKNVWNSWARLGWFMSRFLEKQDPGHRGFNLFCLETLKLLQYIPRNEARVKKILRRGAMGELTGVASKNLIFEKPLEKERWQLLGGAILRKFGLL